MGVVYEHWRPDLNICFYVGMSKKNPDTRPYEKVRDNRRHKRVQRSLAKKGLSFIVKIIWNDLPEDSVDAYEKMRIAYQRALVGEKLTNETDGGDGGPALYGADNPMSRPEVRARHLERVPRGESHMWYGKGDEKRGDKNPMSRPEVRAKNSAAQARNGFWAGDKNPSKDPNVKDSWFSSLKRGTESHFYKLHAQGYFSGSNHYTAKSPEKKDNMVRAILEYHSSERGKESNRVRGQRFRESGKRKGANNPMYGNGDKLTGAKNGRAKVTEAQAQDILDANGTSTEISRKFGVSWDIVNDIRTRKTWKYLIPRTS